MADEDVEMENFSEERAESASDFTAEDENEKVTWLNTFCSKQCFKQKAIQCLDMLCYVFLLVESWEDKLGRLEGRTLLVSLFI